MTEGDFKIPDWLLSSGTLRILALLALFRHPTPPPLIVIEEIENGCKKNKITCQKQVSLKRRNNRKATKEKVYKG